MLKDGADLSVKIFADGADKSGILQQYSNPFIKGFTTNPTLMKKAGINDYEGFARDILSVINDRPISFEVFSDDLSEMHRQALKIASWGNNVNVKIPVTNTKGESTVDLVRSLAQEGVKVNVTALFTLDQVRAVSAAIGDVEESYISVFAGRIADAGVDPMPTMRESVRILSERRGQSLIWASPRELLNLVQANEIGCHVITVTNDILAKLGSLGKDLDEFSLDTVKMFYNDAVSAGFDI